MVHKMRKGTRSCRECRRRKTRCIFPTGQENCKECNYHGRRCVDQSQAPLFGEAEIVDNRPNLRVRVARLESMIERLVQADLKGVAEALGGLGMPIAHARRNSGSSRRDSTHSVVLGDQFRRMQTNGHSPISSNYDTETGQSHDDILEQYRTISYDPEDKHRKLRHELLSNISLEPNIFRILHVANSWWLPWRTLWPALTKRDEEASLTDFVHFKLGRVDLISVAAGLICIAISLHQMRPGAECPDISLSAPPNELANQILTAVDQLVLADDHNLTSLDGLQVLALRAKSYMSASNQPRKSWLLIRRAISMAQLTDMPRAESVQERAETARRRKFMGALFETDRFMSLLLGLPYAVDDDFNDKVAKQIPRSPPGVKTRMRALRRIVALVASKVHDRNTSPSEEEESAMSLIQQALDDAASTLPCEWWNVETHCHVSNDSRSAHEHLLTQLWFYQVQSFLHLPLMLKPVSDARFERSRLVCLSSSRNLLRVYHALCQPDLVRYSSECVDFQALTAVILVLLGLLQQGSHDWHRANAGTTEDLDLIKRTRQLFELSSKEQGEQIACQGVQTIDSLGAFVADGERHNFIRTAALFVPYFGTISAQPAGDGLDARAGFKRTNPIAYSDGGSSPQGPLPRQRYQRPGSLPTPETSPGADTVAGKIPRSADGNPSLPNQALESVNQLPHEVPRMPDSTMTLCDYISPPTTFQPFTPQAAAGNVNLDAPGFVDADIDIDWQSLMADAELSQDWNADLGAPAQVAGELY